VTFGGCGFLLMAMIGSAAVGTCTATDRIARVLEARSAPVDTLPKGRDGEAGSVRSKGSAVPEGQAPNSSSQDHQ
jgi:hypothetical protein